MDEDPDLRLVRTLAGGAPDARREALAELYDRHRRRVFNVALRVVGDRARAEDVVQDVFLRLPDRVHTFRAEAGFSSWLYRITVNRAIDARRREARRPVWRMGDAPLEAEVRRPRGDDAGEAPGDPLEDDARREAVRQALDTLSPKLRAIVVLRYLEGLSYEELAEVLDVSMGTIKSRLNRAHAALARALGGRIDGGEAP